MIDGYICYLSDSNGYVECLQILIKGDQPARVHGGSQYVEQVVGLAKDYWKQNKFI